MSTGDAGNGGEGRVIEISTHAAVPKTRHIWSRGSDKLAWVNCVVFSEAAVRRIAEVAFDVGARQCMWPYRIVRLKQRRRSVGAAVALYMLANRAFFGRISFAVRPPALTASPGGHGDTPKSE